MDDAGILEIYNRLPRKRKEVLKRMLVGQNKVQIALAVCGGSEGAVANQYTQLYERFGQYIGNADPQSQRAQLINSFNERAHNLVCRLKLEYGYHFRTPLDAEQFAPILNAIDEYCYQLAPISTHEIPELQAKGRRFFESENYLSTTLLQSWHKKDPNSFRKLVNHRGELIGFFIVLFIDEQALNDFSNGWITEKELDESTIISFRDPLMTTSHAQLYISVVVSDNSDPQKSISVFLALAKYIDCIRKFRNINKLLAIGSTSSGIKLIKKLGFELSCSGNNRKDNDNFYEFDLSTVLVSDSIYGRLLNLSPAFKRCKNRIAISNEESNWLPNYGLSSNFCALDQ